MSLHASLVLPCSGGLLLVSDNGGGDDGGGGDGGNGGDELALSPKWEGAKLVTDWNLQTWEEERFRPPHRDSDHLRGGSVVLFSSSVSLCFCRQQDRASPADVALSAFSNVFSLPLPFPLQATQAGLLQKWE